MSTVATEVRKYHKSAWVAVIAGGAIATLVGLATAESVLFTAINAEARVTVAQAPPLAPSSADIAPGTLRATGALATTPKTRMPNRRLEW